MRQTPLRTALSRFVIPWGVRLLTTITGFVPATFRTLAARPLS